MTAPDDGRSGEDVVEDVLAAPGPPEVRKDRRLHGGMSPHPDDDELAERTQQERVELGLADYDPDSVPPATDDPVPADVTETEVYRQEVEEVDDEVADGRLPSGPRPDFPPTSYPDR
jgi:hypothetical protein